MSRERVVVVLTKPIGSSMTAGPAVTRTVPRMLRLTKPAPDCRRGPGLEVEQTAPMLLYWVGPLIRRSHSDAVPAPTKHVVLCRLVSPPPSFSPSTRVRDAGCVLL